MNKITFDRHEDARRIICRARLDRQIGLPFAPSITNAMGKKHHWRLVDAKRHFDKMGVKCSYLSLNQIHVHPVYNSRPGFVISVVKTDLPGLSWSLDHFKIWSVDFSYTFVLFACGDFKKLTYRLIELSILKPSDL